MEGVSGAVGSLSAITGASSAAGGAALSGIGFTVDGLAADLGTGDFTSTGLPPLMACNAGLPPTGFAIAALLAVLMDLSALFIAASLAVSTRTQDYKFMGHRDTRATPCFRLLCQHLNPA